MVDAFLGAARASSSAAFMWNAIRPFCATLLNEDSPSRVVTLVSPHVLPYRWSFDKKNVTRWAAAVRAVQYTEEVGQSAVDALLQIASDASLQHRIPIDGWSWLHKRPSLPPVCNGRSIGTSEDVVRKVRALGDVEILKSYLLLVWSEWDHVGAYYQWPEDSRLRLAVRAGGVAGQVLRAGGFNEMWISIREDFSGIGMERHRQDLIERLDHVLGQLDQGLEYLKQHKPIIDEDEIRLAKKQYGELKEVLLGVDGDAMRILTRTPSGLIIPFEIYLRGHPQNLTQRLFVRSPSRVYSCAHATLTPRSPDPYFVCTWFHPLRHLFTTRLVAFVISN
jgi:hypothetical protein